MDIKKIVQNSLNFGINRLIELFGLIIFIIGSLLLIALLSYSAKDPNFIFPENTNINNLLGFRGSFVSDFFFQAFGHISVLIPFTFIFVGTSIFYFKKIFIIISSLFYTILYLLSGSLFFTFFYHNSFELPFNGSGGSTVDTSGKVIYKNPRVSESYDASGSLYNRTFQTNLYLNF